MILNLSNFIHSLLLENETVIIPGFGAFISTYKPAEISENEIKPPSKEISFTNQIKNNDGLLVEIIARKAKISQGNALKRIEKARENMLYELDKGNTVILENIGNLRYNDKNEIEFTPLEDNNLLVESFGFETISKKEDISEKIFLTKETDKHPETTKSGDIVFNKNKKTEVADSDSGKKEPDSANNEIEDFKLPEFQPAQTVEKEEEKNKFAWYWYLLILIPVFIGVYFVIMNNSKKSDAELTKKIESPVQQQKNQIQSEEQKDTLSISSETMEAVQDSNIIKPKQIDLTDQSVSGKYYLIRGGFEEEENVKEYMQQLKAEGVESFVAGKTGRLILVGVDQFDTEEEAMKALNMYFKTNPDWKLWVFKAK